MISLSKNGRDVMNLQKQIVSQPYPERSQDIIPFCNGDENVLQKCCKADVFYSEKKTLSMTSTNAVRISKAQNTLSLPKSFKHLAR